MTATRDLLITLNTLREQNGQVPLKSWKSSRAKLEEAIAKLTPAETPAPKAKKAKKAKVAKADAPTKSSDDLSVADIARELGINPKVARAKLRRHKMQSADGRWPTVRRNSKDYKKIVDVLKGE